MTKLMSRVILATIIALVAAGCDLIGFKIERERVPGTVVNVEDVYLYRQFARQVETEEANGFGMGAGHAVAMTVNLPIGLAIIAASTADTEEQTYTLRVFSSCTVVVRLENDKLFKFENVLEFHNYLKDDPQRIVPCLYTEGADITLERWSVYNLADDVWQKNRSGYKLDGVHTQHEGVAVQ